MLSHILDSSYSIIIDESCNNARSLIKKGKRYKVDGLDIARVIDFLDKNNFRVRQESAMKEVELYKAMGKILPRTSVPLGSIFGPHHREEIMQYTLPIINNYEDKALDERAYNNAQLLIRDRGVEQRHNDYIAWTLKFDENSHKSLVNATRMFEEFSVAIHKLYGLEYLLEKKKTLAR